MRVVLQVNSLRLRKTKDHVICPIVSFAYGFILRAFPEIVIEKYPAGFDTICYYALEIPYLPKQSILKLLAAPAPLFYTVMWMMYITTQVDILMLLKICGPVLYGMLALSFYKLLSRITKWSARKNTLCVVLCMSQLPTLRLSWDLFRNMLGLIFLFIHLTILNDHLEKAYHQKNGPSFISLCLLSFLVTLSHELASILMFIATLSVLICLIRSDRLKETAYLSIAHIPALALFTYQLISYLKGEANFPYYKLPRDIVVLMPKFANNTSMLFTNYFLLPPFIGLTYRDFIRIFLELFLIYYSATLPLALMGLSSRKKKMLIIDNLMIWLVIVTFSALITPSFYIFWRFYRWMLFMVFPISIYAMEGVTKITKVRGGAILACAVLLLYMLWALSYSSGLIGLYFIRGKPLNAFLPENLVQTTIGVTQIDDCIACLNWINNISGRIILLTELRFYPWAMLYLREDINIAVYGPGYSLTDLNFSDIRSMGESFDHIFWIWYAGEDAYMFIEVYVHGVIAIYEYTGRSF